MNENQALSGCRQFCKRLQTFFLLFLLSPISLLAQEQTVSGQITDGKENPLAGANVLIKGTKKGTATDALGRFTLQNVPLNATLVISSQGYATQEVPLQGKNGLINLSLQ